MPKKLNRILVLLFLGLFFASPVFAHLPRIADSNDTIVYDPEISQTFYGELRRVPAEYFIHAPDGFHLYLNLLTPKIANPDGRFSANVYEVSETGENLIATISADSTVWKEMWEKFGRDYYMQGPEFERDLSAGNYKIVVFNQANEGKYVLAIGDKESFTIL
ncbi:hypothetical protein KKG36_01690, partial [Patescibacteria group bacterium]|nr:hypothetical protein [Patescibacteria group bacterium]